MKSIVAILLAVAATAAQIDFDPAKADEQFPSKTHQQFFTIDPKRTDCSFGRCLLKGARGSQKTLIGIDFDGYVDDAYCEDKYIKLEPLITNEANYVGSPYDGINLSVTLGQTEGLLNLFDSGRPSEKLALTIHLADYNKLKEEAMWTSIFPNKLLHVWIILSEKDIIQTTFDVEANDKITFIVEDSFTHKFTGINTHEHKFALQEVNEIKNEIIRPNPNCPQK